MASYQDVESRVRTLESKVDFVMQQFKIKRVEGLIDQKVVEKSLLDLWREVQVGLIEIITQKEAANGGVEL